MRERKRWRKGGREKERGARECRMNHSECKYNNVYRTVVNPGEFCPNFVRMFLSDRTEGLEVGNNW